MVLEVFVGVLAALLVRDAIPHMWRFAHRQYWRLRWWRYHRRTERALRGTPWEGTPWR